MAHIDPLLQRDSELAGEGRMPALTLLPPHKVFLITCLDPRVDPAGFLGLAAGDVIQVRNAGGRVTTEVLNDITLIAELAARAVDGDGSLFEVAVIHHTDCGTRRLADQTFRNHMAALSGQDELALQEQAVLDPEATVHTDVDRLHATPAISERVTIRARPRPGHRAGSHDHRCLTQGVTHRRRRSGAEHFSSRA